MTLETTEELTPEQAPEHKTFAELGVITPIVDALAHNGIVNAFPIQALTLPVALTGADIIGQAKTGTGKTLGFGIPVLQRIITTDEDGYDRLKLPGAPQALIVAPTRELAFQVAEDLKKASAGRRVRIATIYGGRAFEPQLEALAAGVDVVVGTPGRLLDLYGQRKLNLSQIRTVVLDEADEMLDLGFLPDVERLIAAVPEVRQTMLFSATMPGAVVSLARRYMTRPTHIRAADPDDEGATVKNTAQYVYRAHAMDKSEVVARILQAEGRGRTIIFTRTKRTAAKLSDELTDRGFAAGALHGDLGQGAREQAMRAFRHDKVDVLVATDVAARGIDVNDVTHVINYQCPEDEKTYVHRIGRTGRAGNKGTAITFVDWDDVPRWSMIDRSLDLGFAEPAETYSTSPHLYSDLGIPEGTKGRLPKAKRTHAGLGAEKLEDVGETGKKHTDASPSRGGQRNRSRGGHGRNDGRGARGARGFDSQARSTNGSGARGANDGSRSTNGGGGRGANGGGGESGERSPRRRRRRRTNHSSTGNGSANAGAAPNNSTPSNSAISDATASE